MFAAKFVFTSNSLYLIENTIARILKNAIGPSYRYFITRNKHPIGHFLLDLAEGVPTADTGGRAYG